MRIFNLESIEITELIQVAVVVVVVVYMHVDIFCCFPFSIFFSLQIEESLHGFAGV